MRYRFAPTDWETRRTRRYTPLLRIYELEDPARQQMELQLLATLFLQNDNDRVQGLLKGGIDLFVAAGLLAFQRGRSGDNEGYSTPSDSNLKNGFNQRRVRASKKTRATLSAAYENWRNDRAVKRAANSVPIARTASGEFVRHVS